MSQPSESEAQFHQDSMCKAHCSFTPAPENLKPLPSSVRFFMSQPSESGPQFHQDSMCFAHCSFTPAPENLKPLPSSVRFFMSQPSESVLSSVDSIKKPTRLSGFYALSGTSRNRTRDTRIFSPLLYQLS